MSLNPFVAGLSALWALAACSQQTLNTVTPHESGCLEAVADATARTDVGTLDVIPTDAGVTVLVQVGDDETPWVCLADESALVQRVYHATED